MTTPPPPGRLNTTRPNAPWSLRKQDWAYQQLRERILTGALAPGEQLSQEALAGELGISRGPLRDALSRLAAEHLIVDRPHQKSIVAEVSVADARDIYNGRAALESVLAAAAAQAAFGERGSLAADFGLLLERQRIAVSLGDTAQVRLLDRQFHDALYALAAMPATLAALDQLRAKSDRYVALYLADAHRAQNSVDEHTAILDAFLGGDAEQSAALTRAHVLSGLGVLTGSIDRQPATLSDRG
ncbi:GntR family transcriptional regulator [Streptomyces sp. JV176]|uniref:GntR family transcriptional regulator n=1 Tax=Streptomyces sp. JV176 TaxID=858630 RepID=UPI002E774975|nr:GntR family transcriptional regulator [Streptomyces sp. JV176]MEE1802078.1 GntR family transcriptional regulator [Streptomyces sp. JV176]